MMEEMSTCAPTSQIEFFSVGADNWYEIVLRLNWPTIILIVIAVLLVVLGIKKAVMKTFGKTIHIDGMTFGIGDFKCDLKCGHEVQEIAYKLWVELTTRKIAVPLEEDDVIVEVYDSWYSAFTAIRELLKTVPGDSLSDAADLIEVTSKVLNDGLRPHLTKWQAKFRNWYKKAKDESEASPQDLQKSYPEYDRLLADLKVTSENMVKFADTLHEIAFGK